MNVLITGGSRGIGAATARLAAARGDAVAITYVNAADAANELVASISNAGGRAFAIQADVGVEADIVRAFDEAERALGTIDALLNNAGMTGPVSRVEDISGEGLTRLLAVNVTGSYLCAREAIRRMSTKHGGRGGGIVNVSSLAGRIGGSGEWVHYAASKGAVNTFTVGLAKEVAAEGIRVNAVAPGMIETEIHEPAGGAARLERYKPTIPAGIRAAERSNAPGGKERERRIPWAAVQSRPDRKADRENDGQHTAESGHGSHLQKCGITFARTHELGFDALVRGLT